MKQLKSGFWTTLAAVGMSLAFTVTVAAQEKAQESRTEIKDVKPKNKVEGQDVDEIIENRRLRATTGSKSRLSVATRFNYSGGSINDPTSRERPNIRGGANALTSASLFGLLNGKYSLTSQDSIFAGVGVFWTTPFHEKEGPRDQQIDLNDPGVSYQRVGKLGSATSVTTVGLTYFTTEWRRNLGQTASLSLSQNFLWTVGKTGFQYGIAGTISGSSFEKDDPALLGEQSDYSVGFFPYAEYVLNDTFNLRTVVGKILQHTRDNADQPYTFLENALYQSVGLGISVTRDIFFYPNIQFIPEDFRAEKTNVAVSANINVF